MQNKLATSLFAITVFVASFTADALACDMPRCTACERRNAQVTAQRQACLQQCDVTNDAKYAECNRIFQSRQQEWISRVQLYILDTTFCGKAMAKVRTVRTLNSKTELGQT